MFDIEQFPKRLKELREKKGLSQKQLAEMAELTPASLSAYEKENGAKGSKTPTLSTAVKLAEQLEVSLDWLCGDDEEKYKSVSNYAELFSFIIEISKRIYMTIEVKEHGAYDEYHLFAILNMYDETLATLFAEWSKLKNLYESGTIDRDLYGLWIDKQMRLYKHLPLTLLDRYKEPPTLEDFERFIAVQEAEPEGERTTEENESAEFWR